MGPASEGRWNTTGPPDVRFEDNEPMASSPYMQYALLTVYRAACAVLNVV